jgi:hypothetical protein
MPRASVSEIMPASSDVVFDVIHDYARRLEWDTLLSEAYIDDGAKEAGKGVTTVCVGRSSLGKIAIKTIYVSFDRPTVAAVKMVNRPPFFDTWAASIRHEDLEGDGESNKKSSRVTYTFNFTGRPKLVEPIMLRVFEWETKKRLKALREYLAKR